MSTTVQAGAAGPTRVAGTPLVARVYSNHRCLAQTGGRKIVPDAVIDLGDPGPVVLFWQCSARTETANRTLQVQPVINNEADGQLKSYVHVNPAGVHSTLLRRRSLVKPLPQGQSTFAVMAEAGVVTDQNDTVNMVALDVSDMSKPPLMRLDAWGNVTRTDNVVFERTFNSTGGPLLASMAATARPRMKGMFVEGVVYLDGQPVSVMQIFANQADQHIHMVGGDRVLKAAAGQHTLKLVASPDNIADQNDFWSITVMEMQGPSSATAVLENAKCENQNGDGLIASGPYESKGGEHMICVWVSGYTRTANKTIQARVLVDDNPVGRLQIHANQADTHALLCGGDIAVGDIPQGKHTIKVVAANTDTVTDFNDRCSITVLEVYR